VHLDYTLSTGEKTRVANEERGLESAYKILIFHYFLY
jgi:hypothetical protein